MEAPLMSPLNDASVNQSAVLLTCIPECSYRGLHTSEKRRKKNSSPDKAPVMRHAVTGLSIPLVSRGHAQLLFLIGKKSEGRSKSNWSRNATFKNPWNGITVVRHVRASIYHKIHSITEFSRCTAVTRISARISAAPVINFVLIKSTMIN